MIVFDLLCLPLEHRFEGWFRSSEDFALQHKRGLISCPQCGCTAVDKAIQAPRLARKGNQVESAPAPSSVPKQDVKMSGAGHAPVSPNPVAAAPTPEQLAQAVRHLAAVQAEILKSSRYVGKSFAEDARAMHYGEREVEQIHGQATPKEAQDLMEEGIAVMPLALPVAGPDETH